MYNDVAVILVSAYFLVFVAGASIHAWVHAGRVARVRHGWDKVSDDAMRAAWFWMFWPFCVALAFLASPWLLRRKLRRRASRLGTLGEDLPYHQRPYGATMVQRRRVVIPMHGGLTPACDCGRLGCREHPAAIPGLE